MNMRTCAALLCSSLVALGVRAGAQSTSRPALRMEGASFVFTRYVAGGSVSVYLAGRAGRVMAVAGAVGNPGTGYRAVIVGGGTRLRLGPASNVTGIVAGAGTSDGPAARLYLLSEVTKGPLLVAATAVACQPLGRREGRGSRREASMDPLAAAIRLSPRVALGAVMTVDAEEHRPVRAGLGPSVQLRLLGGTAAMEVVGRRGPSRVEVRGSFSAAL